MLSMTGFGKGMAWCDGDICFTVELSSVNRKQLELRFTAPPELAMLEPTARRLVQAGISRGAVHLRVGMRSAAGSGAGAVDETLLANLVEAARGMRRRFGLSDVVEVEALMQLPGVLGGQSADLERPEFTAAFEEAVSDALKNFQEMRRHEGENLGRDLDERLSRLEKMVSEIKPWAEGYPAEAQRRLRERLTALGTMIPENDERLLKEVLFYAERADVAEELTRLASHFTQFRKFLADAGPTGRSLDFLIQEMFREITTLGNKAGSVEISPLVVAFKSELEKLREQVQNVE